MLIIFQSKSSNPSLKQNKIQWDQQSSLLKLLVTLKMIVPRSFTANADIDSSFFAAYGWTDIDFSLFAAYGWTETSERRHDFSWTKTWIYSTTGSLFLLFWTFEQPGSNYKENQTTLLHEYYEICN